MSGIQGQRNIILECDKANSLQSLNSDETDNKINNARWTNQLDPVLIKKGSTVNLENCLINIRGANSESIEFYGNNVKNKNYTDNFSLLNIGYYVNNNCLNNLPLPAIIRSEMDVANANEIKTKKLGTFGDIDNPPDDPTSFYIDNRYGAYINEYPFSYFTRTAEENPPIRSNSSSADQYDGRPYPLDYEVYNIGDTKNHINPYLKAKTQRLGVVIDEYMGQDRNVRRGDGLPIFNRNVPAHGILKVGTYPNAKILKKPIPLSIPSGFINPQSVADNLTIQMQLSNPPNENIENEIVPYVAQYGANIIRKFTDSDDLYNQQKFRPTYAFTGKTIKCINANFSIKSQTNKEIVPDRNKEHHVYNNILVENPIWYENGTNFLMNTKTFNFNNDNMPMNNSDLFMRFNGNVSNNNGLNFTVNYPSLIVSRFRNLAGDNDPENYHNYDVYTSAEQIPNTDPNAPKTNFISIFNPTTTVADMIRSYQCIDKTNNTNISVLIYFRGVSNLPNNIQMGNYTAKDYVNEYGKPSRYIDTNSATKVHLIAKSQFYGFCLTTWTDQTGKEWRIENYKNEGFHNSYFRLENTGTIEAFKWASVNWTPALTFVQSSTQATINGLNYQTKLTHAGQDYYLQTDIDDPYVQATWFIVNLNGNPIANPFNNPLHHGRMSYNASTRMLIFVDGHNKFIFEASHPVGTVLKKYLWGNMYGYCPNRDSRVLLSNGGITSEKITTNNANIAQQLGTWTFDYNFASSGQIVLTDVDNQTITLTPANFQKIVQPHWNFFRMKTYNTNVVGETKANNIELNQFITENTTNAQTSSPNGFGTIPAGTYTPFNGTAIAQTISSTTTITAQNPVFIYGRFRKYEAFPTNVLFDLDNLNIIKDLFKNCEVFDGEEKTSDEIKNSKDYKIKLDLGRSDDDSFDPNIKDIDVEHNIINVSGLAPSYMKFRSTLGNIETDPNPPHNKILIDNGVVYPRLTKGLKPSFMNQPESNFSEQRVEFATRRKWCNDDEIIWEGDKIINDIRYPHHFINSKFELTDNIKECQKFCEDNDILVIPYECGRDSTAQQVNPPAKKICCAFICYKDYTNDEILKLQNFTYFGFSPSSFDNPIAKLVNKDTAGTITAEYTIKDGSGSSAIVPPTMPIAKPKYMSSYCNYCWVGATNPTFKYNSELGKFQISDFHTPYMLNQKNADSTTQGQIVARLNEDIAEYTYPKTPQAKETWHYTAYPTPDKGVLDSISGIFISDLVFQSKSTEKNNNIISITDERATIATKDNYYGSIFWKLGFKYHDLKPMKFSYNSFNNRFNKSTYNNYSVYEKIYSISPFTTNSMVNINNAVSSDMFGTTEASVKYETPNDSKATLTSLYGLPRYGLGLCGNIATNLQVDSDFLTASSISVQIQNAYYRIYSNIPTDTINYQDGLGGHLSCVGYALRNYASSSYYYSYAMSFNGTVSRDIVLSSITTEIRGSDGKIIENLDERCSIIYKITENIEIGDPPPDPNLELLSDIKKEIQNTNKIALEAGTGELQENADIISGKATHMENIGSSIRKALIEKELSTRNSPQQKAKNIMRVIKKSKKNIENLLKKLSGKTPDAKKAQLLENFENQYNINLMINENGDLVSDYEEGQFGDEEFRTLEKSDDVLNAVESDVPYAEIVEIIEEPDDELEQKEEPEQKQDMPEAESKESEPIPTQNITLEEKTEMTKEAFENLSNLGDLQFPEYIAFILSINNREVIRLLRGNPKQVSNMAKIYEVLNEYINGKSFMRLDEAFDLLHDLNGSIASTFPEQYNRDENEMGQKWVSYVIQQEEEIRAKKLGDPDDEPEENINREEQDKFRLKIQEENLRKGLITQDVYEVSKDNFIKKYGAKSLKAEVGLTEAQKTILTEEENQAYKQWVEIQETTGKKPRGRRADVLRNALSKMTEIAEVGIKRTTPLRGYGMGIVEKNRRIKGLRKELSRITNPEAIEIKKALIKEIQDKPLTKKDQRKLNWFKGKILAPLEKIMLDNEDKGAKSELGKELRKQLDHLLLGKRDKLTERQSKLLDVGLKLYAKRGFIDYRKHLDIKDSKKRREFRRKLRSDMILREKLLNKYLEWRPTKEVPFEKSQENRPISKETEKKLEVKQEKKEAKTMMKEDKDVILEKRKRRSKMEMREARAMMSEDKKK